MNSYITKINQLGMELDEWKFESCIAHFGIGDDFATLYDIVSGVKRKGHATTLLTEAKEYYEDKGLKFGGSVALNENMRNLYVKLGIEEYDK